MRRLGGKLLKDAFQQELEPKKWVEKQEEMVKKLTSKPSF